MKIKATVHPKQKVKIMYKCILFLSFVVIIYSSICICHHSLYSKPDYVCRHMARDIENDLEWFGLDVTIVRGNMTEGGHRWFKVLGVEFDSISLLPWFIVSGCYNTENVTYYNSHEECQAKLKS